MPAEKSFLKILSLSLCSKCPVCERGRLFVPYLQAHRFRDYFLPLENCESCRFQFGREPGYYFGVLTPTLSILALGLGILFSGISYFLFHLDLVDVILIGALGLIMGLILFFRTAIAVFIAFDHAIDPPS
jgi:uncharacterized protein (DUF983 family)